MLHSYVNPKKESFIITPLYLIHMEAFTQIILSLLGILGIGSIITTFLNKHKEIEFQKIDQKQKRYKSTLLFMDVYNEPKNIKYLSSRHPDIHKMDDVIEYLKSEYHEMILYASKEVVISVKQFIEKPNRKKFLAVILAMRKDLWIKKQDLNIKEIEI